MCLFRCRRVSECRPFHLKSISDGMCGVGVCRSMIYLWQLVSVCPKNGLSCLFYICAVVVSCPVLCCRWVACQLTKHRQRTSSTLGELSAVSWALFVRLTFTNVIDCLISMPRRRARYTSLQTGSVCTFDDYSFFLQPFCYIRMLSFRLSALLLLAIVSISPSVCGFSAVNSRFLSICQCSFYCQ